jgi:hypothetical protein
MKLSVKKIPTDWAAIPAAQNRVFFSSFASKNAYFAPQVFTVTS